MASIYGSQSRYPYALEIEIGDMNLALADSEKIYDFASEKINSLGKSAKKEDVQEKKAKMAGKIDKYEIVIGC